PDNPPPDSCVCCKVSSAHRSRIEEVLVRKLALPLFIVLPAAFQYGCRDASPEVQRVPTPAPGHDTTRPESDHPKPLPGADESAGRGPTPFYDEPLVVDIPPEAKAFVDVYRQ